MSARATATDPERHFELCSYTDDADAAARRVLESADELRLPQLEPWRERRAYYSAPDGTLSHIAQPA